jgi:CxxC motif-containing protein (DUF1111 family)
VFDSGFDLLDQTCQPGIFGVSSMHRLGVAAVEFVQPWSDSLAHPQRRLIAFPRARTGMSILSRASCRSSLHSPPSPELARNRRGAAAGERCRMRLIVLRWDHQGNPLGSPA